MKRISASLFGSAVLGAALLAACGGGGGTSGSALPGGGPPPVATTPPSSSTQSFSATDAIPIPTPAPGALNVAVPLPSDPSGASANALLPASASIPPDATITATYSSSGDSSLPALSAGRSVNSRGVREDSNKKNVVAYLRLQFSADVTLPQAPAFSFVVPQTLPTTGVTYWLAFLDPLRSAASWQQGFEGPAVVSATTTANGKAGTQLAFASNGKPVTFTANETYYFVVYAVSATAATPTPVPSSVPSNPPHDAKPAPVVASPSNVQFATVTSSPVPVTFSQSGFTGTFTLHGDCTGIVNTGGSSPTFILTPVGQGRCVVVGLGDRGATAVVHIGVVTAYETPHPTTSRSPEPTHPPTTAPSTAPSHSPEPTHAPTTAPSRSPEPTHPPTTAPSSEPSHSPEPTHAPTTAPTNAPGSSASPTPAPNASTKPQ